MATKKTVTATENLEATAQDATATAEDASKSGASTGASGNADAAATGTGTASSSPQNSASTSATASVDTGTGTGQTVTASYEGTFTLETAPVEAGKNIIREAEAPTYTPEEFAKVAYKIFDVPYPQDIVLVALKLAGKKAYTKAEAEAIVKAFAHKEV